jgi:hypothetical protein
MHSSFVYKCFASKNNYVLQLTPAKNSKFCSFSTLLNHQNMILGGSENSWMVMNIPDQNSKSY